MDRRPNHAKQLRLLPRRFGQIHHPVPFSTAFSCPEKGCRLTVLWSCLCFASPLLLSFFFASFLLLCFFGPRPLILSSLSLSCCWSSSLEICAAASSSFCFLSSCFDVVVLGRVLCEVFLFFFFTFAFSSSFHLSFHLVPSAFLGEASLFSF